MSDTRRGHRSRRRWEHLLLTTVLLGSWACAQPASSPPQESPPRANVPASFVNRVWQVAQSTAVAPGTLYVFLADGTLIVTATGSKPMVGTWTRSKDGLVMVEESHPYQVEILALSVDRFTIRSHNPGEPVDITMVPAEATEAQRSGT